MSAIPYPYQPSDPVDRSRSPSDSGGRANTQVWIDFDGTITRKDVLDELIAAYAINESWRAVEVEWQSGRIGSYDCLRAEFDVLRINPQTLDTFLRGIAVDPGAVSLFESLQRWQVPTAILSDGVESFIRLVLDHAGITRVPIRANRIDHVADRLNLLCPHRDDGCRSKAAHCKCASIRTLGTLGHQSIYIGDGRSDLCPARDADVVFAKNALARILTEEGRPFIPFETLFDVERVLSEMWLREAAPV